jgi:hypothetical protein
MTDAWKAILLAKPWLALGLPEQQAAMARISAKVVIDTDRSPANRALRSLVKVFLDELNVLRGQTVGVTTVIYDPPNLANNTGTSKTDIVVAGAAFGDIVDVAAPYSLQGVVAVAYVHQPDTIGLRLHNSTGGAVNLASGAWSFVVRRHAALPPRTKSQAQAAIRTAIDKNE